MGEQLIRRFNRYELKYILPVERTALIIEDLKTLALPDPHGGERGYPVVSLYYDSPGLDFFWAKIEGIKFRRKLRLRIYPGEDLQAVSEAMVEIKQRINRTVQKRRLQLSLGEAERLCRNESAFRKSVSSPASQLQDPLILPAGFEELDPLDQQVASEVRYLVIAMNLSPTCITAYHRRAYIGGLYDAGLRITFDTNLCCRVHALKVNETADNHHFASPKWCIMEVKVNEAVPEWVTYLLARHGCQLTRVSKYCAGVACSRNLRVMPLAIGPPVASPNGEPPSLHGKTWTRSA